MREWAAGVNGWDVDCVRGKEGKGRGGRGVERMEVDCAVKLCTVERGGRVGMMLAVKGEVGGVVVGAEKIRVDYAVKLYRGKKGRETQRQN